MFNYTVAPYHVISRGFWLQYHAYHLLMAEYLILHEEARLARLANDDMHLTVVTALLEDCGADLADVASQCGAWFGLHLS